MNTSGHAEVTYQDLMLFVNVYMRKGGRMKTLKEKALACAIRQMDNTWCREAAKEAYLMWKCFHLEKEFIAAVKRLQKNLKERGL